MTAEIVTLPRPLPARAAVTLAAADSDSDPVSTAAAVVGVAGAVVLALVLAEVLTTVLRAWGHRRDSERTVAVATATRAVVRVLFLALAGWGAVLLLVPDDAGWRLPVARVLLAGAILAGALALGVGVLAALRAPATDRARRRRALTRGALVAVLGPLALAGALAVAPATRPAALWVLILVVAVLVAMAVVAVPLWRAVLAGWRLTLTDVVRPGDVVEHEGELAVVEHLGRTTGVLRVWDDRRVVVPHEHWFAAPVVNLTRRAADLLGTVDVDVDRDVVVADLRAELGRLLQSSATWDHRIGVLQVVGATGDRIRVRAVVSAADPGVLADLRAQVREGLVEWLRTGGVPAAGPTLPGEVTQDTVRLDLERRSTLFSGALGGFAGPGPEVMAEREGVPLRRRAR